MEHLNFKGFLIEVGTIIFAVLVALGAESWWEHHKTMEMVDMSVERINNEVTSNLYSIVYTDKEARLKYEALRNMEKDLENSEIFAKQASAFNGYSAVIMNTSAWKRILNDKVAAYFPVDYVERTYNLYQYAERFEDIKNNLMKFVFSELFVNKNKVSEAYAISKIYYKELTRLTEGAIEDYKKFIKDFNPEEYYTVAAKCDSISNSIKSFRNNN